MDTFFMLAVGAVIIFFVILLEVRREAKEAAKHNWKNPKKEATQAALISMAFSYIIGAYFFIQIYPNIFNGLIKFVGGLNG